MGWAVYVESFGETKRTGIPRAEVRLLFPVVEEKSEANCWSVRYDERNSCDAGVTPIASNPEAINGLYVDKPCADLRLWQALVSLLRMGSFFLFGPGSPPIVADPGVAASLPDEIIEALGSPKLAATAEDVLRVLEA